MTTLGRVEVPLQAGGRKNKPNRAIEEPSTVPVQSGVGDVYSEKKARGGCALSGLLSKGAACACTAAMGCES